MPLYSDVLRNTNSNAPCLNVNDLQIQGFGIFADTAARDALNETIRTEGYVASMKDDDKLYVYTSSDSGDTAWQDAANWVAIGSGGGNVYESSIGVAASGELTFSGVPADGDTVTIGGVDIYYVTAVNTANNRNEIEVAGFTTATQVGQITRRFLINRAIQVVITDLVTGNDYYKYTDPFATATESSGVVTVSSERYGEAGNSVATTTTSSAASWAAATLSGGTDVVVDTSANRYITVESIGVINKGAMVGIVEVNPVTGRYVVNDTQPNVRTSNVLGLYSDGPRMFPGDVFDVLVYGVAEGIYVAADDSGNKNFGPGTPLYSKLNTETNLSVGNGNWNYCGFLMSHGAGLNTLDNVVFFVSPLFNGLVNHHDATNTSSSIRLGGHADPGVSIPQYSLVVIDPVAGVFNKGSATTVDLFSTPTYAASDIVGITTSAIDSSLGGECGLVTDGMVGRCIIYNASGNVIKEPVDGNVTGSVIYAGDGTVNAQHLLTTDPTSGIAVGRVVSLSFDIGFFEEDSRWDVLFQPARVAIGSGGGGSFRAIMTTSASVNGEIVIIIGFDSSAGLPRVAGKNESPAAESEGALMAGVVVSGSSGDEVDVLVSGEYEDFRFGVDVGVTPTPGQIIYGGLGSQPYVGILGDEAFAIGRLLGDFTLEQSYPGFYDVYRGRVYLSMPVMNAFYDDSVSYYESQRFYAFESGTVEVGEIVKYVSISDIIYVSRWDSSSGDTVDDIAGVTTSGRASSEPYSSVCNSGSVRYDLSVIGGATPVAGDIIYADSTNSYQLTTASTSGVKIGLVQNVNTPNSYVRINLKFI